MMAGGLASCFVFFLRTWALGRNRLQPRPGTRANTQPSGFTSARLASSAASCRRGRSALPSCT